MSHTIDLLNEVLEFLEPYVDVSDGSYGEPRPNKAMSLTTAIEQEIERLKHSSESGASVKTPEGHRQRHVELHKALDELFADYIDHHRQQTDFTGMPLRQLLQWSHEQTINPSEKPHG